MSEHTSECVYVSYTELQQETMHAVMVMCVHNSCYVCMSTTELQLHTCGRKQITCVSIRVVCVCIRIVLCMHA